MPTDREVRARIEARRWAEECFEAASDGEAFCERVMHLAGKVPKPVAPLVPMTHDECRQFEKRPIFFGVHKGESIGEVELSYLCRLTDPSDEIQQFMLDIKRYLANPDVKRRMEEE